MPRKKATFDQSVKLVEQLLARPDWLDRLMWWTDHQYPQVNLVGTVNQYPDQSDRTRLAYQLVARRDELANGPIVKVTRPTRSEWIGIEITGVELTEWRGDQPGVTLRLLCRTGQLAGVTVSRKFPIGWLSFLAYQIGFTRRLQYDPDNPAMLVRLRMRARLVWSEQDRPVDFDQWALDREATKHNRLIIARRTRFDVQHKRFEDSKGEPLAHVCPFDYDHDCGACQVSHTECPAVYAGLQPVSG